MSTVTCVRCAAVIPLRAADIVGTGHRCNRCTVQSEIDGARAGDTDVGDDLDPALRVQLERRAKRRMRLGLGMFGLLLAPIPLAILTSSLALMVVGMIGVYYSMLAGEIVIGARRDARRYGARALPTATARQLPASVSAAATSGGGSATGR